MHKYFECCAVCGCLTTTENYLPGECSYCKSYRKTSKKEKEYYKSLGQISLPQKCIITYKSKYPIEHYEQLSFKEYNTITKAYDIFIKTELSKLPSFDYNKYLKTIKLQKIRKQNYKIMKANNQHENLPKCPTCQSTNVQKIGSLERGVSVAALGLMSSKIGKTMKCNNCGYKW